MSSRLIGILWFLALPVAAGGWLVERIEFEGRKHIPESILRAELRLDEGSNYSETELREALYRLERLHFILDVDFALRKGSKRGAYRLVVTVEEARRFFWLLLMDSSYVRDAYIWTEADPPSSEYQLFIRSLSLGYRWFFGKSEVAVSLPAGISYTHYGLFRRNATMSVSLSPGVRFSNGGFNGNSPHPYEGKLVQLGLNMSLWGRVAFDMPVKNNQWINFRYNITTSYLGEYDPVGDQEFEFEDSVFALGETSLGWTRDTTDHPIFGTTGSFINAGASYGFQRIEIDPNDPNPGFIDQESDRLTAFASGLHFRELQPDRTVGINWSVDYSDYELMETRFDDLITDHYASMRLSLDAFYARNLMQYRIWGLNRDLRFQARAGLQWNTSDLEHVFPDSDYSRYFAELSLTSRDRYGTLRFSIGWSNVEEELWP